MFLLYLIAINEFSLYVFPYQRSQFKLQIQPGVGNAEEEII